MTGTPFAPEGYGLRSGAVADDEEAVLSVWRGNLGRESQLAAKYEWFYRRCPFGVPLVWLLGHAGSNGAVGVAAAGPRRMLCAGRPLSAGLLVDLAVSPAHRSLLPAMALQKALMGDGLARFAVLYGFPNSKAEALFKRVGYRQATTLVRYVRVLRTSGYFAAQLPRGASRIAGVIVDACLRLALWMRGAPHDRCDWQDQPWTSIDAVWRAGPRPEGLMTIRDAQFVRWRLAEAPHATTRFFVAMDRRSGEPVAWAGCEIVDGVMHVRDGWSTDAMGRRMAALLDSLAGRARAAGCASMSLEFQGDRAAIAAIRRAGFVARTSRPVYAIAPADSPVTRDSPGWHLTSADEDE